MNAATLLVTVLAVATLVYLLYTMLRPERF